MAWSTMFVDLFAAQRLPFEQAPSDAVEAGPVLGEHLAAPVLLVAQDPLDLFVDDPRGLVGVVAGVHEVFAEEHRAL